MDQESKELLSVSDFAAQAGKTTAAIYQQIKGRLKPYVQAGDDGKTYISADALTLYGAKPSPPTPPTPDKEREETKGEAKRLKKENEDLRSDVDRLSGELPKLTGEVARLQDTNAQLTEANERLRAEITKMETEALMLKADADRLKLEKDHLTEMLARERELSSERRARLEAADQRIDILMDKIPPMLPPPSSESSGGVLGRLFGKRKGGSR